MSRFIVITRAKEKQDKLYNIPIKHIYMPCLEIKYHDFTQKIKGDEIIIISSKNGIKSAIASLNKLQTVVTVGKASEEYVKSLGFINVFSAQGTAKSIVETIKKVYRRQENHQFVYLSAAEISYPIDEELSKDGYKVKRIVTYESQAVQEIDASIIKLFVGGIVTDMLFYSVKTADSFMNIAQKYHIQQYLSTANAFTISKNITKRLRSLPFSHIVTGNYNNIIEKTLKFGSHE